MDREPYGFLTRSGLVTAVLTVVVVVVLGLLSENVLFSPGGLNAKAGAMLGGVTSHAGLSNKCAACHTSFWQSARMADRCMACHTDIKAQLTNPKSLHGIAKTGRAELSCRSCHSEHAGPNGQLTNLQREDFPHQLTGYSLAAHQVQANGARFGCRDCHANGYVRFDQAVCRTCHMQIKAGFMQAHLRAYGENCLNCHDGVDTNGHAFNHATQPFHLTGKHAEVACAACHPKDRSLADLRATPTDCAGCHARQNPHSERVGTNCGACHKTTGWSPAAFDHNLASFLLLGKHIGVPCEKCHLNHVIRGTPSDCHACHAKDDKHKGAFGSDCVQCHQVTGWLPSTFNHTLLAFQLTGKHKGVACANCHVAGVYKGAPTDCAACHIKVNPHSAFLGTDCGSCHTTAGWLPATINHNLTSFPLTGKHITTACSACHINGVYQGTPRLCFACHEKDDFHKGLFGSDCSLCHTTNGWLPAFFNHSGFPLTGGHAGLACSACHASGVFKGLSTACAACHTAPANHSGFGSDCATCHTINNWNFNHPNGCGEGGCLHHNGATCADCHPASFTTYTCRKCHSSNNPGN